jgi:hypothetical protein
MRAVLHQINPILVMSILVRLFLFDIVAWILFRGTPTSPVTLVAFIVGATILSCGVGVRIMRREPAAVDTNVKASAKAGVKTRYGIPLSDRSSIVM